MIILMCCMIAYVFSLSAQEEGDINHIARLLAEDPEDLSEEEVERLSILLERPIAINVVSEGVLNSCGIFTRYQVASLMDYRKRSGPCMSFMELSALNGFSDEFVERLKPFLSLEVLPDLKGRTSHEIGRAHV